jgi:hypothetical protein
LEETHSLGEAHSRGVEGARVKEGAHTCGVFARGGAHLSIVRTKPRREALLCRGCKTKGKGKGQGFKQRQRQRQAQGKRAKGLAREEGRTKAKGALLQWASRHIFKGLQSIQEWLLLYQVHLYMFSLLYILL